MTSWLQHPDDCNSLSYQCERHTGANRTMSDSPDLNLWFDGVLVGHIREPFQSDGTWFGILERAIRPSDGELARRIWEFIRFCGVWNERVRDDSADAAEFDGYADVVKSGLWATTDSAGRSTRIADAPVFFRGDEVTWAYN